MLETLTYESFVPLLNQRFTIGDGRSTLDAELVEVKLSGGSAQITRQPFSLLFLTSAPQTCRQGIFSVAHASIGVIEVFLVPVGPDPKVPGSMVFQAVFA